ncbi:glycosyltransferase family 2 protein [Pelagibacteraceae bacterium]|jgi:dolichol-phosphate mannosyltransferase|nr:glycosyltransferase family 2 protein [Pelagibacteraceae bacterium]
MKLLSVVFSFRNEEDNIKELVDRINSSLEKLTNWKYELIFVNDDSTDNSEKILLELQKKYSIRIINMSRNFGVDPCVLAGFRNAEGDAIVYLHTDLQDPPEIIPELVKKHEEGFEVVHTVRTKRKGEGKFRMFVTKIAYHLINILSDINLPIEAGDYKLISRKALDKILNQKEFRPYVRGLSVWVGFKQSFHYYERQARGSGESKMPLLSKGPVTDFLNGITSYSLKPLYMGIFLGFFSILISAVLIIYALYLKFNGLAIPGATSIIIAVSFFSGILLFTLGVIGIYLARIFEQTKGRDQYVIKEIKDYK